MIFVVEDGSGWIDYNGFFFAMKVAVEGLGLFWGWGGVGVKIGSEVSFFFFYSESLFFRVPCVAM